MIDFLDKVYEEDIAGVMELFIWTENGKNERTRPFFYFNAPAEFAVYSSEPKAENPLICIRNIGEPVDTLTNFHYNIPAVSDYTAAMLKKRYSQSFDEPFLVHARHSKPLDPDYDVIGPLTFGNNLFVIKPKSMHALIISARPLIL